MTILRRKSYETMSKFCKEKLLSDILGANIWVFFQPFTTTLCRFDPLGFLNTLIKSLNRKMLF